MQRGVGVASWQAGTWLLLLAVAQLADVMTTGVDMSHGAMEGNPTAFQVLALGGLTLLWLVKFMLVAAIGIAALLAQRLAQRRGGPMAVLVQVAVLRGMQLSALALALTALHNAFLLTAIRG
jgi:hypothetical protein